MKSGIYKIQNKINKYQYIGSSQNIEKRYKTHINSLKKNKHHSILLQRAWNKYKSKNFIFNIIYECIPEDCLKYEQYYINYYKPEYNISLDSCAPMRGRKHKKSTIIKFKARKVKKGKEHPSYGTKWSKIKRKTILEARKGFKHTEKTKKKMSKTAKRLNRYKDLLSYIELIKKPVYDSEGRTFNSASEAAKYNKVSVQTCCDILKKRHYKTRKGISFYYA